MQGLRQLLRWGGGGGGEGRVGFRYESEGLGQKKDESVELKWGIKPNFSSNTVIPMIVGTHTK